jgi:hypothetical protein
LSRPGSKSTWPNKKGMCAVWTKGQPKSGQPRHSSTAVNVPGGDAKVNVTM